VCQVSGVIIRKDQTGMFQLGLTNYLRSIKTVDLVSVRVRIRVRVGIKTVDFVSIHLIWRTRHVTLFHHIQIIGTKYIDLYITGSSNNIMWSTYRTQQLHLLKNNLYDTLYTQLHRGCCTCFLGT
jgi:hypothetical protein